MFDDNTQEPVNAQDEQDRKKVDVNEAVTINDEAPNHGEYLKQNESQKDALKFYGYSDLQQFLQMVGSDGTFAQKVVLHLMGVTPDTTFSGAKEAFSSQESNRTGLLDHKGDTPLAYTPMATEPVEK